VPAGVTAAGCTSDLDDPRAARLSKPPRSCSSCAPPTRRLRVGKRQPGRATQDDLMPCRCNPSATPPARTTQPQNCKLLNKGVGIVVVTGTHTSEKRRDEGSTPFDSTSPSRAALWAPAPCDRCRFRERCAADRLACDAFAVFMTGGEEWRWSLAPRVPTRARYAVLFGKT
jgi:hypothetical protein